MIAIQTANLTKKYGDIIAINGVDLEVTFFCERESQTAREKRYRYRYGGLYWQHERSGKPADVRFHVWHAQGASPYTCGAAFEEA